MINWKLHSIIIHFRDEAEKYMSMTEIQAEDRSQRDGDGKSAHSKKRRVRPIPLTSRIPLYDKLVAAKEERSAHSS